MQAKSSILAGLLVSSIFTGHTGWRANPIALALILGPKRIDEIEASFPNQLFKTLTTPFTRKRIER